MEGRAGRGWRLDSEPFIIMARKGCGGHGLHGYTSRHFDGAQCYTFTNGQFRFCSYSPSIYETEMPEWFDEPTEVQKAVLESPYVHSRPLIEDDVETLVRPGAEPKDHIPRKRHEF